MICHLKIEENVNEVYKLNYSVLVKNINEKI